MGSTARHGIRGLQGSVAQDRTGRDGELHQHGLDRRGRGVAADLGQAVRVRRRLRVAAGGDQLERDLGRHRRADWRPHLRRVRPQEDLPVRPAAVRVRRALDHLRAGAVDAAVRLLRRRPDGRRRRPRVVDADHRDGAGEDPRPVGRARTGALVHGRDRAADHRDRVPGARRVVAARAVRAALRRRADHLGAAAGDGRVGAVGEGADGGRSGARVRSSRCSSVATSARSAS